MGSTRSRKTSASRSASSKSNVSSISTSSATESTTPTIQRLNESLSSSTKNNQQQQQQLNNNNINDSLSSGRSSRSRLRSLSIPSSPSNYSIASASSISSVSSSTRMGNPSSTPISISSSSPSSITSYHYPITEVPAHLAFNPYVLHYYRKCPLTIQESLLSLFYFHNETFNIFSHLIGGLICGYWIYIAYLHNYLNLYHSHWFSVAIADFGSMFCFFGSCLYHTFMNVASEKSGYVTLMQLDVWGIWIVNSGAALVLTHTLFPCGPHYLGLLLIMGPIIGSWLWIMFIANNPPTRAKAFAICWLVRILTIIFSAYFEVAHWPSDVLFWHLFSEVFPFIGAIINVKRWPEYLFPGYFDRLGQSHNLMHICVAIGMLAQHYLGTHRSTYIDSQPTLLACAQNPWEFEKFWST